MSFVGLADSCQSILVTRVKYKLMFMLNDNYAAEERNTYAFVKWLSLFCLGLTKTHFNVAGQRSMWRLFYIERLFEWTWEEKGKQRARSFLSALRNTVNQVQENLSRRSASSFSLREQPQACSACCILHRDVEPFLEVSTWVSALLMS